MSSDISFVSGPRLNYCAFYRLSGNGIIEKIAEEMDMHAKFRNAEIDFQKKSWKKPGDFKFSETYNYAAYLRFRCLYMKDCATKLELANAQIKFKDFPIFYDNGNPFNGIIEGDQVYEGMKQDNGKGIKLKGDKTIFFFRDGRLKSATLAEDCVINGLSCKAGTVIGFYESGKLRYYTPTKNINITLEDDKGATTTDTIMAGTQVEYYESGRIRSYVSAKTGKFEQLYDNGNSH